MHRLRRFFARVACFVRPGHAERELAREIAAHLDLIEDDFRRAGMAPPDAHFAALRAYGGVEHAKELHRDARSFTALEQVLQDLRHAWRSLAKSRTFAAVAIVSLAFGIGVNTAIFTLVNGVLLKTLAVPDAQRVVELRARMGTFESSGFTYPVYRELRRQRAIFHDVIGFAGRPGVFEPDRGSYRVEYALVTGGYFRFFNARPALGRLLNDEDDAVEGARRVCVLSYRTWESYFAADPGVLHRTVRLGSVPFEVVGVAAPDFVGPELQRRYDLFLPTAAYSDLSPTTRENPNSVWVHMLARLAPGISAAEASSRLAVASRGIEDALPKGRANAGAIYAFVDGSKGFDYWRNTLQDPLRILMAAVTIVLLVACANLANLVLARAGERRQEFAVKLSLGISRGRLMRQLLFEILLIAAAGGGIALLLATRITVLLLNIFNLGNRWSTLYVAPDRAVLLYTFAGTLLTALVAGLYPAWQAARTDPAPALKAGAGQAMQRAFVRRGLILVQVGLAVVLLFGASLFTRSLRKLKTIDLGYDIDRVLTINLAPRGPAKAWKPVTPPPELGSLLAQVRRMPAVESAAMAEMGVLTGATMTSDVHARDGAGTQRDIDDVRFLFVSPGYLGTLRIPLLRGRDFTSADRAGSQRVAIVNQHLAARLWPRQDPIGRHFDGWTKDVEVVGVMADSRYEGVRGPQRDIVYQPFDQTRILVCVLEVRGRIGSALERDLRSAVRSAASSFEVTEASTMELLRDRLISQDRLLAFLANLFAGLGIVLALVGIYGLISYSVTRRTREVGIRVSVGASPADVLRLFVRESIILVAAGAVIGLPLALWLSRYAAKLLYEVSAADPIAVAATLLAILAGGVAASWIPGRRATRIDPVKALRSD